MSAVANLDSILEKRSIMKLSRRWIYSVAIVPVLGAAGFGAWKLAQPEPANADHEVSAVEVTFALITISTMPGEPVNRVEQMTCELTKGWPVILVRDANDRSPWWVQGRAERKVGQTFSARAHFGNESTEAGQRYQIVVLSTADESAAQRFETGTTLDEIPRDLTHSELIEVVRQ